jgi:hypothetical protein
MAVLSAEDREALFGLFCSDVSSEHAPLSITKADLRAAVNAIDQWTEDNQASFNLAIPQPARGALTIKQKVRLLYYVLRRRYEVT